MIKVPGEGMKPFVPPITPKEAKGGKQIEEERLSKPLQPIPKEAEIGKGPELDARAIAVRLAASATEAKKKDIDKELKFEEIVKKVIEQTGLQDAEAAMEEASHRTQKEIETILEEIKSNRDLMEEAEAWQDFAELLSSRLSQEQLETFFGVLKEEIKNL
jgi:hypothetical protein